MIGPPARLGFIGTGLMGLPMARNLLRAGFNVIAWNRTREKAIALKVDGGVLGNSPSETARNADAVILMLQDGAAVTEILSELVGACRPGALIIDMSSIAPAIAKDHAALAEKHGLRHLDAPVSGGTVGAEAGKLTIMVGGDAGDFSDAEAIFNAMGMPSHLGPSGSGQLCKLANLTIVAVTIGAVAEALTLVQAGGGDLSRVREVLLGGFSQSRILELHGKRMIDRTFEPGGRIKNQLKDLATIFETAARYGIEMPLTWKVCDLFRQLRASHGEELDHSALILQIEAMRSPVAATVPTRR